MYEFCFSFSFAPFARVVSLFLFSFLVPRLNVLLPVSHLQSRSYSFTHSQLLYFVCARVRRSSADAGVRPPRRLRAAAAAVRGVGTDCTEVPAGPRIRRVPRLLCQDTRSRRTRLSLCRPTYNVRTCVCSRVFVNLSSTYPAM